MKNSVLVLLSTYNGSKYLTELIKSVLNQKDVNVNILVRDDGSRDDTVKILKEYERNYENIKCSYESNVGYAKSFWNLLRYSDEYDYYAFCDQDDVWLENKLIDAVTMLSKQDNNIPLLYTSNVIPVDEQLNRINNNSFKTKGTVDVYKSFQKSFLPGCTFVFNNKAKKIAEKYDGYMESHDWALYNIVNVFGRVVFGEKSNILYRIYADNTIGQESAIASLKKKVTRFFNKSKCTRSNFAKDFYRIYKESIPSNYIDDIYQMAYYKDDKKTKIKLFFNKNFRGFFFKMYVLLNKV